jgi:hypothetical protein
MSKVFDSIFTVLSYIIGACALGICAFALYTVAML